MTDLLLGDAAPSDIAAFPALLAQLGYPSEGASIAPRLERVRAAGGRVIVARRGEAVLGLMALAFIPLLHHDADLCRVSALVVAGHARGAGIGRRLMALAEQIAHEHGCSRVEVTSAEHRVSAHAFYHNLGYADRPRRFIKQLLQPHDLASGPSPASDRATGAPRPHSDAEERPSTRMEPSRPPQPPAPQPQPAPEAPPPAPRPQPSPAE